MATGAQATRPPIDGLNDVPTWDSEQALTSMERPRRLAILGGGVIGCELAQVYSGFGTEVTVIEAAATLLPREAGWLGEEMAGVLRAGGVAVHIGSSVTAVTADSTAGTAAVLHAEDGLRITADRVLVAIGKQPRSADLGLERVGVSVKKGEPLDVDRRCRVISDSGALDSVFAIGDVTAAPPYTHTANYQGRTVAAHLLGRGYDADLTGIPRVVYTDPPVLSAGETAEQARENGRQVLTASFDVTRTTRARLERIVDPDDERPARLELVADASSGVLIGIAAIGPEADSWGAELSLAVRRRTTMAQLADAVHAFPSWTEAIHIPARELAEKLRG